MKYKDYYAILGVDARRRRRTTIKTAYRKLARKYHPDVSKEKDAEEKFKDMAEAYETLKDPEKRAAYDQLGKYTAGRGIPAAAGLGPAIRGRYAGGARAAFDDIDLSDLFAGARRRPAARRRSAARRMPRARQRLRGRRPHLVRPGVPRYRSATSTSARSNGMPDGTSRRVPHRVKARIPRGVTDGEKLRVPGKGGKGVRGGPDGDLYLDIEVRRASGVSRRWPGPVRRPAARAVGSGARHQRAAAHARRCRVAQGAARHARRPATAPGGPRHRRAARGRPAISTRSCASKSPPSSTTRQRELYRAARRGVAIQSACPTRPGGRPMNADSARRRAPRRARHGDHVDATRRARRGMPEGDRARTRRVRRAGAARSGGGDLDVRGALTGRRARRVVSAARRISTSTRTR